MRRDRTIMRLLLRKLRDGSEPPELSKYPESEIVYNAKLLIDDGYVEGHAGRGPTGAYVRAVLVSITSSGHDLLEQLEDMDSTTPMPQQKPPPEIAESLARFRADHPDPTSTCFIMMRFGTTRAHEAIASAIRDAFQLHGITALRADDKHYHDDLFPNVLTYLYGCGLGVAVYERLEEESFNPNVSLEVGYLFAMRKHVLILKDNTLKTLQTDLVGKLYKLFDPQNPRESIPPQVDKWLQDKGRVGDPSRGGTTTHSLLGGI